MENIKKLENLLNEYGINNQLLIGEVIELFNPESNSCYLEESHNFINKINEQHPLPFDSYQYVRENFWDLI